jgi:filamentous hemagglutinin
MSNRSSRTSVGNLDPWLRLAVLVVLVGLVAYGSWQRQRQRSVQPSSPADSAIEPSAERGPAEPTTRRDGGDDKVDSSPNRPSGSESVIRQQTIRDQDGHVVFRGDVDVGPTLDRIHRDERLSYSHDGIVFQNRERRLPRKPGGYYHEYVHPTPKLGGPGPQRIIVGGEGEIYYTPDHYRTFRRLDE